MTPLQINSSDTRGEWCFKIQLEIFHCTQTGLGPRSLSESCPLNTSHLSWRRKALQINSGLWRKEALFFQLKLKAASKHQWPIWKFWTDSSCDLTMDFFSTFYCIISMKSVTKSFSESNSFFLPFPFTLLCHYLSFPSHSHHFSAITSLPIVWKTDANVKNKPTGESPLFNLFYVTFPFCLLFLNCKLAGAWTVINSN